MEKQILSIEQMNHLRKMGLDTSDANMCWSHKDPDITKHSLSVKKLKNHMEAHTAIFYGNTELWINTRAYTFHDVIEKLPKHIEWKEKNINTFLSILYDNAEGCVITYSTEHINDIMHSEGANTDLEAAYKMLCWCIENDYVKHDAPAYEYNM